MHPGPGLRLRRDLECSSYLTPVSTCAPLRPDHGAHRNLRQRPRWIRNRMSFPTRWSGPRLVLWVTGEKGCGRLAVRVPLPQGGEGWGEGGSSCCPSRQTRNRLAFESGRPAPGGSQTLPLPRAGGPRWTYPLRFSLPVRLAYISACRKTASPNGTAITPISISRPRCGSRVAIPTPSSRAALIPSST